jgi:enoyl-CoA hydratase/carnithine racemase
MSLAAHRYALGGGLVMVAQCDIVIAVDTATFGLPEINVGVMGGTKHLARIEAALEVADDICSKSPVSVRLMKEVINLTEPMDLDNGSTSRPTRRPSFQRIRTPRKPPKHSRKSARRTTRAELR